MKCPSFPSLPSTHLMYMAIKIKLSPSDELLTIAIVAVVNKYVYAIKLKRDYTIEMFGIGTYDAIEIVVNSVVTSIVGGKDWQTIPIDGFVAADIKNSLCVRPTDGLISALSWCSGVDKRLWAKWSLRAKL